MEESGVNGTGKDSLVSQVLERRAPQNEFA